MFGLRLGEQPRVVVTTTPKPVPLLKEILFVGGDAVKAIPRPGTLVTRGSTYDNRANLPQSYLDIVLTKYQGTTFGRQEIEGELLEESEGALWKNALIEKGRVQSYPDLVHGVVGIDPSGGVAEIGIVSAGISKDGHVYILSDESLRASPDTWGAIAISQYVKFKLDHIVGEKNFGGEMVEHVIESAAKARGISVRYKPVLASRGKVIRAEPVVALYEQGRVHHVGTFPALEAEMTTWVPGEASPNRIDALVWAVTELAVDELKPVQQVEVQWG
jgi:phage terminase large subunit-like protein